KESFFIGHKRNLESVDIRETNLESFHCNCQELYCLINLVTCRNIRVLELNECCLSEPYLQLIVDVISVKCPNLSHFTCLTAGFEDVYLDCPKLRTCCYKTSARVPRYRDAPMFICTLGGFVLHAIWWLTYFVYFRFARMSLFLMNSKQSILPNPRMFAYNRDWCTRTWELTTAFVDSLVWSTCPTT
ncbi:maturase K, partial [Bienertia sinuspersici]